MSLVTLMLTVLIVHIIFNMNVNIIIISSSIIVKISFHPVCLAVANAWQVLCDLQDKQC